ncbi:MAG TPA: glycosyl hydrolase [Verrucomicrobiae bacterium]|nr:glycosyl hydrolase [Verrucomicrobiae bacterium]
MRLKINRQLTAKKLVPKIEHMFELSAAKILDLEKSWDPARGTPVFTVKGRYTTRGWTEWTQGFQFGSALLQFDATGDKKFLEIGRRKTRELMAPHVSHVGVHDHGFNNISTYGTLLRLMREGKLAHDEGEQAFYELALKTSGAVQAARWTPISNGKGFIYSFNGPHSLFIDTLRSLRSLGAAHQLGHVLMGERDRKISLLERLIQHAETTAEFAVYYGEGRDAYDERGRVAHESIFNVNDGNYRCPNSQQGYSPFSTWTRGLAWAICGFAEQIEFLKAIGGPKATLKTLQRAGDATAKFYLENCCADGVPMWDTGAPNLWRLGAYDRKDSDPYNDWEPVDSSAAAIAAQGLLRLGHHHEAFTIAETLLSEPYLSTNPKHQGLLLHSVYHRPIGWDYIAPGRKIPNGESSMWGDYHLRELALLILREARGEPHITFWS